MIDVDAKLAVGRLLYTKRSMLDKIYADNGLSLTNLTHEGLAKYRERLPVLQTFMDLLLRDCLTKQGTPRKARLDRIISPERAEELWRQAQEAATKDESAR